MYKCWICGKSLATGTDKRNFCPECAKEKAEKAKANFNEYWRLKNAMTLERAVSRIEEDDSYPEMDEFKEAIETVAEYVEKHPQRLDSTEEYIALIVLLQNECRTICQYKVLNYRIDFCLPELKVLLEIDGDRHNKAKDSKRDLEILGEIGSDWTIVRIPTKYINQYPKQIYDAVFDYKIEYDKEKAKTPAIVLQRLKAIEAAKEERALRLKNREIIEESDWRYSSHYVGMPKKK